MQRQHDAQPESKSSAAAAQSGVIDFGSKYTSRGDLTRIGAKALPAPPLSPPFSSGTPSSSSATTSDSSANTSTGRPPSSATSVAMSDAGKPKMQAYPRHDSMRSTFRPDNEEALQKHYETLKAYLASNLQDEKGNIKPNRARDKLLRLSVTQFMELSTDVYDELNRREDERLQRMPNTPRFLPPKKNFHPKRNQARQKLSTLPIERFRQLATDVFYELERRIPTFSSRPPSSGSNRSVRGGPNVRPPPPGTYPRPLSPGPRGPPPGGFTPYRPASPAPSGPMGNTRPSNASPMSRPYQKGVQSNTLVPNKGVMVEDDEGNDGDSGEAQARLKAQEAEISEYKERMQDLEGKISDVQNLNDDLRAELNSTQADRGREQSQNSAQLKALEAENAELRAQIAANKSSADHVQKIKTLEQDLAQQRKLAVKVHDQAAEYLKEMRELSRENDRAVDEEDRLAAQVRKLESEIEVWKQRYSRLKARNVQLRSSTYGFGIPNIHVDGLAEKEGLVKAGGLIRDHDITRYQVSVEELLQVARQTDTDGMLETVKQIVTAVQHITASVASADGYPTPSPSPHNSQPAGVAAMNVAKLKARVIGTANSLITATKHHATSSGLSPVALLDAAASNLTASVVALVKAVGIRRTSDPDREDAGARPTGAAHMEHNDFDTRRRNSEASVARSDDLDSFYGQSDVENEHESEPPATYGKPSQPNSQPSNTVNKTNGWFSWRGSANDDNDDGLITPTPQIATAQVVNGTYQTGHKILPAPKYDGEEYDPYR